MLGRNGGRKGIVDADEWTNRVTVLNVAAKHRAGMNHLECLLIGSRIMMQWMPFSCNKRLTRSPARGVSCADEAASQATPVCEAVFAICAGKVKTTLRRRTRWSSASHA
jgi:hypothetical protein